MTDDEALRLAEALVFASATPVGARALSQILPDDMDADTVLTALRERYTGRGVELVETGGGVQFRTAPDLAPLLRKVIEIPRRLPRVAMETLAIIAYHQPVTRPEIEEIRGASLSQQTLDALLEADLVAPQGPPRKSRPPNIMGHHPALPRPVRPQRPPRTTPPRGPAARATLGSHPHPHPPTRIPLPRSGRLAPGRLTRGVGRGSWKTGSRNSVPWRTGPWTRAPRHWPLTTDRC